MAAPADHNFLLTGDFCVTAGGVLFSPRSQPMALLLLQQVFNRKRL